MGVFDLDGMDVPDNKGGRPPKEEEEDEKVQPSHAEEPYPVEGEEDEEFFQRLWDEYYEDDVPRAIGEMCNHTALPPWEVIRHLHTNDVHDFIEYSATPYSEEYVRRSGILDTTEAKQDQVLSSLGSSNGTGGSDDDDEPSSGLQSLIDG